MLACVILALVGWLSGSGLTLRSDNFMYDYLLPQHERVADSRIVLLRIDERSMETLGAWPWRRSVHGELFEKLAEAGPRAVLFDVILTESADDTNEDMRMVSGMASLKQGSLVAPVLMTNNLEGSLHVTLPIDSVQSVAKLGHIAILPDDDGVVREVGLSMMDESGKSWPLMSTLLDDGLVLPVSGTLRIPFNVPQNHYMSFSVSDVLAGRVPVSFLRDKYILIGATAVGLGDRFPTPNAKSFSTMPGVEIQANVLDALLNGLNVKVLSGWGWALLPVMVLLVGLLLLRERYHLLVFVTCIVLYVMVVSGALWFWLWWIPPVASLCGLAAAYVFWSWRRMAVMLRHVKFELIEWRAQTGAVDLLLPSVSANGIAPHALELNIAHAQHLSQFVTGSLQDLPVAVLLVGTDGVVLMHNTMAQTVFARQQLLHSSVMELLDLNTAFDSNVLEGYEWLRGTKVYRVHVVPMRFSNSEGVDTSAHVIWQIILIDLSNERTAQHQRNELMTFLSHDLRVPQVGILSLLEMFRWPVSPLTIDSLIEQVGEKVHHTLEVAGGLVHLSHAQDGHYMLMEVNMVDVLDSVTRQISAQASAKSIRLIVDDSMHDLFEQAWVWGDSGMLTRTLLNLLSNAVRYSEAQTCIYVSLRFENNDVVCSILDQGQGMSTEQITRLNQSIAGQIPIHNESSPDAAGSLGVGLHMVATVVRDHHGRVVFRNASELGFEHGTQVEVYLPALPVEEHSEPIE